ncbi:hypothetical protein RhiXN_03528 [Rhizoctonia solani]|uniref:Uncharacterized protein n=1 Tax=Rhizoctonia solani TaxID=456999 RepID=A0A8H8NNP3_9AGAM|nr:uncharacterized protein RhiXN_03528 [Rhizoctonia solani]QRW15527.1 hypothetical protein RhiXN_03528 [Rhizoctonia solani]
MPPRLKAHFSQVEKTELATQRCKKVPRATRSTAGTNDTLPEATELASALTQQAVCFAKEDGAKVLVDTDRSGAEGRGEGAGGDDKSDSEGKGKDKGSGKGPNVSKPSRKPAKGRKGCAAGSAGYSKAKEWLIVEGMQKYLPRSKTSWRKVARYYNCRVDKKRQRKWELIKNKYGRMVKKKKPTGNGKGLKIHNAILGIKDLHIAQEEIGNIDNNEWLELGANEALDKPPLKKPCIKIEATSVPVSGPAPAPFRWPKPTPSKLAPKHQEPEILILSLTNNNASPQTTPAKHKPHPGVKAKPGNTYYTAKAPQPTKVKANTGKRHRNAQTLVKDLTNTLKNAAQYNNAKDAGVAKVKLFGCNVSKEQLERDLAASQEQCHQLERQLDTVVVAMTMFGIQVPAANQANGPGLGLALLEFLQSHLPAVASPAAVLAAAAPTAVATAHAAVPVTVCNAIPAAVPAAGLPTICAAAPLRFPSLLPPLFLLPLLLLPLSQPKTPATILNSILPSTSPRDLRQVLPWAPT